MLRAEKIGFKRAEKQLTAAAEAKAEQVIIKALDGMQKLVGVFSADVARMLAKANKNLMASGVSIRFTPEVQNSAPAFRPGNTMRRGDKVHLNTRTGNVTKMRVVAVTSSGKKQKTAKAAPAPDGFEMTTPKQKILDALMWVSSLGTDGAPRSMIGFLAGASPKSSAFGNNLGSLKTAGLILYRGDDLTLTDAGAGLAVAPDHALTHVAIIEKVASKLQPAQMRILTAACDVWPRQIERVDLAHAAGASATSSAYGNNLGALKSLGLLDFERGSTLVIANSRLFPDRKAA